MGTTYYLDPGAGSNTAPYDTWAKAATSLQTLADLAVAGDICYCRGTETYAGATTIDFDTNDGSLASGYIKFIGCNAAGNVDGTRFVVNVNSKAVHGITVNAIDMVWFENIEIKNAGAGGDTKSGIALITANSNGWVFINCCSNTNSGNGFIASYGIKPYFIRCVAYSNTTNGFNLGASNPHLFFCTSRDNTADGYTFSAASAVLYGCLAHGNGDDGYSGVQQPAAIINCVSDGNTDDGIEILGSTQVGANLLVGCRITNHSGAGDNGLTVSGLPTIAGWCYFENNTDNINDHTSIFFQPIPLEGGSTSSNLEDLSNTEYGYVDVSEHDFSTGYTDSGDPDLRRTAITLPWS